MATFTASKPRFVMPKGMYAQDHVLAVVKETHIRDLAPLILARRLAAVTETGNPTALYRASLAEAEEALNADF